MEKPVMDPAARVAPGAVIVGGARLCAGANVWYNAVIRADLAPIVIGENSNVQDGCVLHVSEGCPVTLGRGVTIGHGAIVHGCTVGDNTLVGMGAVILDRAVIGKNCIIAAGAVVTVGAVIPDGSMVMGVPARIVRQTTPAEHENNRTNARHYVRDAREQL